LTFRPMEVDNLTPIACRAITSWSRLAKSKLQNAGLHSSGLPVSPVAEQGLWEDTRIHAAWTVMRAGLWSKVGNKPV